MQFIVFWLGYRGYRKRYLFFLSSICDKQLDILADIYPCSVYFNGHLPLFYYNNVTYLPLFCYKHLPLFRFIGICIVDYNLTLM